MVWKKKDFPTIPGYESRGDSVESKRWLDFRVNQLLDTGDPVWEVAGNLDTREEVCNFVIKQFKYPFKRGRPTDKHLNDWFDGNARHEISEDFWMSCSETLRTLRLNKEKYRGWPEKQKGYGDCEDTSSCFVTLFLEKGWEAKVCLGIVKRNERVLGGHGFAIAVLDDDKYHLIETTLDRPPKYPEGYPKIDPESNIFKVGKLTYEAYVKFDRKEYYEFKEVETPMDEYISMDFEEKNRREKFEAIAEAWKLPVSSLEERN